MKKETTFENYTFWDAYNAVSEEKWSKEEFFVWAQTVWNDGANSQAEMEEAYNEK